MIIDRLRMYRRRWCNWRGHPISDNAPICIWEKGPSKLIEGRIIEGDVYVVKAYRCDFHG